MEKALVIVESPAKAKTISKVLGSKYTVKASMGHVRDLPRSQFGVDIAAGFVPKYITIRGKGNIVKELREAAKKAGQVILATDPDREGEAISWHLAQLLDLKIEEPCRIEFHEITKQAIQAAIKQPRPIDLNLVNAQQARRILDRIVGYELSPLLWHKVRYGLSAGRVQSVAVKLICDREREIKAFIPQEYWTITARLQSQQGENFEASLLEQKGEKINLSSATEVQKVEEALQGVDFTVTRVEKKERKRSPLPPFITSTLQQEASRKLGFSPRKTMQLAQQLYEGLEIPGEGAVGLVTYIRTDAVRVAKEAQEEAAQYIAGTYGETYRPSQPPVYKAKGNVQGAHEAIRPTSVFRTPEKVKPFLKRDLFRLYQLIWERFVASQMAPAVMDTVSVDIVAGDFLFRATGSVVKFPGFLRLYQEGREEGKEGEEKEEKRLPFLAEGEKVSLVELLPEQHFTEPPPRYTEASLVKTMEELGIGRPSTYAPTIETILERGYVQLVDKHFVPTELGCLVVDLLQEYFPDIVDVEFTAEMENELDKIEAGEIGWVEVLEKFNAGFQKELAVAREAITKIQLPEEETEEVCEACGRKMVIRHGRFGKFLACPGFPECRNTKPLLKTVGVVCPRCGGQIVERRTKKGRVFYGCQNYPQCTFSIWAEPVPEKCPKCGQFLVVKRHRGKAPEYACVNEACDYRRTDKGGKKE